MTKKPKGWYKEIVLRPVVHVDGYASYEKVCSYVAEAYYSSEEKKLQRNLVTKPKESMYITLYTLFKVGQAKCPVYWVGKDLLSALMQSDLNIEVENLNWAMNTGIFMLPKGAILSPEKKNIQAICWHHDTNNNFLYWTAIDGSSFFCRKFLSRDNSGKFTYVDVDAQDINSEKVTEFNERLQPIFLRLILIMQCRPELVDIQEKQQKVTVKKGFGKAQIQDLYQPLWIGQGYRLKREGNGSSVINKQGGTKRPHWRRGFIRNQPYGEGRQKIKMVWIEPVLVMGGD